VKPAIVLLFGCGDNYHLGFENWPKFADLNTKIKLRRFPGMNVGKETSGTSHATGT